ncbi:hypothetical protein M0R45_021548 [Rubus argutus]|uniref:Uncharacterized protein n=1 Tax=Rubus argutus TaxID=59490 RepID=A0AAW1XD06_RUBAR
MEEASSIYLPDGLSLLSLKSAVDQSSAGPSFLRLERTPTPRPLPVDLNSCMNVTGSPDPPRRRNRALRQESPGQQLLRLDSDLSHSTPTSLHSLFLYGKQPLWFASSLDLLTSRGSRTSTSPTTLSPVRWTKYLEKLQAIAEDLILARNRFSGEIPAGIWSGMENYCNWISRQTVFTGSVPEDFGELKSLSGTLNLSYNHLSGKIRNRSGIYRSRNLAKTRPKALRLVRIRRPGPITARRRG